MMKWNKYGIYLFFENVNKMYNFSEKVCFLKMTFDFFSFFSKMVLEDKKR